MRPSMLKQLSEALPFPVYVFREGTGRSFVDRVENADDKLTRQRYFLTARQQCTCLGYMKFQKPCKHLQMLTGDDAWVKTGVPASVALDEAARLVELLAKAFGKELVQPIGLSAENLPELVKLVSVQVQAADLKDMQMVVSRKKFPDLGDLGLVVSVEKNKPISEN